jgi:hypothetical protein
MEHMTKILRSAQTGRLEYYWVCTCDPQHGHDSDPDKSKVAAAAARHRKTARA